ncbi:elongin-B-like [Uranotaenia lowii]|uniref:elongin-B-like n=1 Tax=Uranotaenia lowii TaxID=190385 RepID=UPI002479C1DB|nr:elongin-B-like [Uranotaenia lowii]
MDVFLMIRRKKTTIFTEAKETTPVYELKRMIEGILKVPPQNQRLFNRDNQELDYDRTLQDCGITVSAGKAQCPAQIGLAIRGSNGEFEPLDLAPYSMPPDLPDVMKHQDAANQGQE